MITEFKDGATDFDILEAMRIQITVGATNPAMRRLILPLKNYPYPVQLYTVLKSAFDLAYFNGDTADIQTVRDALNLITEERANCIDYSVFIGTALLILDIPFILRMVSMNKPGEWTHVYVQTQDGITLDAVLGQDQDGNEFKLRGNRKPVYNEEVPYRFKHDLNL